MIKAFDIVFKYEIERERQTETSRQGHTIRQWHADRERLRDRDRQKDRQKADWKQTERQINVMRYTETEGERERDESKEFLFQIISEQLHGNPSLDGNKRKKTRVIKRHYFIISVFK